MLLCHQFEIWRKGKKKTKKYPAVPNILFIINLNPITGDVVSQCFSREEVKIFTQYTHVL